VGIITHLISEFTAGEGARDGIKRTIFAVGDEKQSIFSFQGAAPREFDLRRKRCRASSRCRDEVRSGGVQPFVSIRLRDPAVCRSRVSRRGDLRSIHAVENGYPIS